jgi:hypothetical protein
MAMDDISGSSRSKGGKMHGGMVNYSKKQALDVRYCDSRQE